MAKDWKKKAGAGRPPRDDSEALKAVRLILDQHPKWSRSKAALEYAKDHPEAGTQPSSTARRLADKLRREAGVPSQRRATQRKLLKRLQVALLMAYGYFEQLWRLDNDGQ